MKTTKKHLLECLERMKGVTVAVAGDLLADVYISARPVGLSREAPVMVLAEESQQVTPGGAANAVNNLVEFSRRACCAGIVGDDPAGLALAECLEERGVDCSGVVRVKHAKTCTKTRVFAGDVHTVKQQIFRLDCLPSPRVTDAVESRVLAAIDAVDREAAAWLVSDYHGDFFTDKVVARLNCIAAAGKVVVVDSHRRLGAFRGVACATPNEQEASLASGIPIRDDESAAEAARALRLGTGDKCMFITRGNHGMTVLKRDGSVTHLPIVGPSEIVDVAGAGDTVAALVTLAFALGEDAVTAGLLASYAASVVVMKTGVATASLDEVRSAIEKYPLPLV